MAARDWITKDFGWKLFSLVIAVLFWIAIRRNIGETPSPVMPFSTVDTVVLTNLPVYALSGNADVRNAQLAPNVVTVQLSGPAEIMAMLEANKVHVVVNLTGIDAASGLPLPVDISAPLGVMVDRIDPPKISVTFSPATE